MKIITALNYDISSDQNVFKKANIDLGKTILTLETCTYAGSRDGHNPKPNEDAYSVLVSDKGLFAAVFDGSSSLKPIESLKNETGARFASHFLKLFLEGIKSDFHPIEVLTMLRKGLLEKVMTFKGTSLEDIHTLPASTATLAEVILDDDTLTISHVGDSFCLVLYENEETKMITIDRNKIYDDRILGRMKKIATERKITVREARKDPRIELDLLNMYQQSHNTPDGTGQGIMNGDASAEQYFQHITLPLHSIKTIMLGTDGIIPPGWNEQDPADQRKIFQILQTGGLKKLIETKLAIENNDPDFEILRYKHSDDATGIVINLK